MKINEKLRLGPMSVNQANHRGHKKYRADIKDENPFISLIFTLRASWRLPSAVLLRAKHR
jgi:hypothetical protein